MRTEVGHGGRTRDWGIGPGYGEIREIHKKDKIYSKYEKDQKYEKYENYEMSRVIRGSGIRGEPDGARPCLYFYCSCTAVVEWPSTIWGWNMIFCFGISGVSDWRSSS